MSETKNPDGDHETKWDPQVSDGQNAVLRAGLDYYMENGLMVFTAAFLGSRGYCCERGCRHCPYGYCEHQSQLE